MNERHPPSDIKAEAAVLGSIMLDNTVFDDVSALLNVDDFYREAHRYIYLAMTRLAERNEPIEIVTLATHLLAADRLKNTGGGAYLSNLTSDTPASINVMHYARIVRDKAIVRNTIGAARAIVDAGYDNPEDVKMYVDAAQGSIISATEDVGSDTGRTVRAAMLGWFAEFERRTESEEAAGIQTGFHDVDKMICGLMEKEMVIVAGRPSMGKSALAVQVVLHASAAQIPCHIISLETGESPLISRLISMQSGVNLTSITKGRVESWDMQKVQSAIGVVTQLPIHIDDHRGLSINDVASRARKVWRQQGTKILVVDYIQLLRGTSEARRDSREREISSISSGLSTLAGELQCTVIGVAQLNRDCEKRANKRPIMSDLRESGALEQDADDIIFLYRDEYYNPDDCKDPGACEVIVAKNRNGPTGRAKITFVKHTASFKNRSDRDDDGPF